MVVFTQFLVSCITIARPKTPLIGIPTVVVLCFLFIPALCSLLTTVFKVLSFLPEANLISMLISQMAELNKD